MDVDDVGARVEMIVPHLLEQHRAGDHAAFVAGEIFEQQIFARLQVELLAAALHAFATTGRFRGRRRSGDGRPGRSALRAGAAARSPAPAARRTRRASRDNRRSRIRVPRCGRRPRRGRRGSAPASRSAPRASAFSTERPSSAGSMRSRMMRSKLPSVARNRPSWPFVACSTLWPSWARPLARYAAVSRSSSTSRILRPMVSPVAAEAINASRSNERLPCGAAGVSRTRRRTETPVGLAGGLVVVVGGRLLGGGLHVRFVHALDDDGVALWLPRVRLVFPWSLRPRS